jgi:hypothetical protein
MEPDTSHIREAATREAALLCAPSAAVLGSYSFPLGTPPRR